MDHQQPDAEPQSALSDVSSLGSSTAPAASYFPPRFPDGRITTTTTTQRKATEYFMGGNPRHSSTTAAAADNTPPLESATSTDPHSPPRLLMSTSSSMPSDEEEATAAASFLPHVDTGDDHQYDKEEETTPQHLSYYRVVYRGVVSLLSGPSRTSPRSGAYVSYGEIIVTSGEKDEKVICVDQVLTGGYTVDALVDVSATSIAASDHTPKRGNTHYGSFSAMVPPPSPLPLLQDDVEDEIMMRKTRQPHGYLLIESPRSNNNNSVPIVVPIDQPPVCERGEFLYKVISSTPLAVYMGPSIDAPTTKGMLVPGTAHEVCLRVVEKDVCYLRLTRRRGWVADRRIHISNHRNRNAQDSSASSLSVDTTMIVMKDVTDTKDTTTEDPCCALSVASVAATSTTSSLATPVPSATRRHRPPRRRREVKKEIIENVPRHVPGPPAGAVPSALSSRNNSYDQSENLPQHSQHSNQPPPHHHHHAPTMDRGVMSPSSNVSLLSDESSSLEHSMIQQHQLRNVGLITPDRSSIATRSVASSSAGGLASHSSFFLMQVNAPRGLKILDAPHFQVNNLIRGSRPSGPGSIISASPSKDSFSKLSTASGAGNQSIFQTMSGGHHTTTLTSKIGNPAVFDSNTKARKLPRGSLFEASKRMEASGAFSQGSGLIKLSDNSGWAIVPKKEELDEQYRNISGGALLAGGIKEGEASRAFEEVGNAIVDDRHNPVYIRILTRGGVTVSLPPSSNISSDDETSPTSSAGGSSSVVSGGNNINGSGHVRSQDSDVASSVGSSFLDAMFRTPARKPRDLDENRRDAGVTTSSNPNPPKQTAPVNEKLPFSTLLPCGSFVEVERWTSPTDAERHNNVKTEYVRLRGGQGWIPRSLNGKPISEIIAPPEIRFGSFWFRVQDRNGIKVRWGPSKRAPSIKSEDGIYFRFECGEFLRASEVVTFFRQNAPAECYAKLYRNRHVRLYAGHGAIRPLSSLTVQAEWVQVFGYQELFLEECAVEPRIERHSQGWRYNVVLDARVQVRKGPSFEAEANGVVLLGGESVLINERVTGPDDTITWLRLKDGQGWVHNVDSDGEALMIPHSLRHRKAPLGRPTKAGRPEQEEIAYNTIIARLFHNQLHEENQQQGRPKRRWN